MDEQKIITLEDVKEFANNMFMKHDLCIPNGKTEMIIKGENFMITARMGLVTDIEKV